MNLHSIVSGIIGAVNPQQPVTIRQSAGAAPAADGKLEPAYRTVQTTGQLQPVTGGDIQRLNSMNVQGVTAKMYLTGNFGALIRATGKGGDLILFGGKTYLVSAVLERWPDWCCVALTMQVN
jgi:hypothetical protein